MATLVLTAVGTAIGGPLGGAIGAALGQQVDQSVFGNGPARQGPRLKELDVQTSSYGSFIPAIFGAMRVAGTVIWASDLIESTSKSSNGKGRPATQNYSYSVNMAVALSSRPLQSIGRIWADGNLLRGAAGDFKTQAEFRFYSGHDNQNVDPLLASAEVTDHIPAHRGIAYVVFEGLQLADFGNRIPSLTFEVFERTAPVTIDDIAAHLSNGLITGNSGTQIIGYAATGSNARSAISPVLDAMPVNLETRGDSLRLIGYSQNSQPIHIAQIVQATGSKKLPLAAHQMRSADKVPARYALRYYEHLRDYQTGIQTSNHLDGGVYEQMVELPAALDTVSAKLLSETQLAQLHRQRFSWSGHVAVGAVPFATGDWIMPSDDTIPVRIVEVEVQRGYAKITGVQAIGSRIMPAITATPGRHLPDLDIPVGTTSLIAMDLPSMTTAIAETPIVALAVAGSSPGWRGAALSQITGSQVREIGQASSPAVFGSAANILPPHPAQLFDTSSALDIDLLHAGMELPLAPVNGLCWIEGEIIRYKNATALSSTGFRLSGLERGLFNTADRIQGHNIGDRFVLLDSERLQLIDFDSRVIGQSAEFSALGLGDSDPVTANVPFIGKALYPRSPVHARLIVLDGAGAKLSWIRRARVDFGWVDGVDHPLGEDQEQYAVSAIHAGLAIGNWTANTSELVISANEWAAIAALPNGSATFEILQLGRYAISAPLIAPILFH
jgi:Putative phage tail protein